MAFPTAEPWAFLLAHCYTEFAARLMQRVLLCRVPGISNESTVIVKPVQTPRTQLLLNYEARNHARHGSNPHAARRAEVHRRVRQAIVARGHGPGKIDHDAIHSLLCGSSSVTS